MAGENENAAATQQLDAILALMPTTHGGMRDNISANGGDAAAADATIDNIRINYYNQILSQLAEQNLSVNDIADQSKQGVVMPIVMPIIVEMDTAISQELTLQHGDLVYSPDAIAAAAAANAASDATAVTDNPDSVVEEPNNPASDAAPVEDNPDATVEEATATSIDVPEVTTTALPAAGAPAPESSIPAEGYTTQEARMKAMQEVLILPAIVEITGIDGHTIGNSTTGLADGIQGPGTESAFAALVEASRGQPDMKAFLEEQGVSSEDATKFLIAHASHVGAGNDSLIGLPENDNAVADLQTAFRTNDAAIGLSANGIDVNTGSSTARDQSDNNLGPLTARSIQATVALAITDQAPNDTIIDHRLNGETIGYVQAYLTEQGVEGADEIAANLRRVANDPELLAQYESGVVPDSVEYAGLEVPATGDNVTDMAMLNAPSVAEGVDGVGLTADGDPQNLLPPTLASYNDQASTGVDTATMTGAQLNEMIATADSPDANRVALEGLNARNIMPVHQDLITARDAYTGAMAEETRIQTALDDHTNVDPFEESLRLEVEVTNAETALETTLRTTPVEPFDFTYTTGPRGRQVEHTETFEGSLEDFEERFGDGGFIDITQPGETSARPQMEAAYAALEASPEIVAAREEIAEQRAYATDYLPNYGEIGRGLQSDLETAEAATSAAGETFTEAVQAADEAVITFKIPSDDMDDPQIAEAMVTDAGGTYDAAAPAVEPEAPAAAPADELMADNPQGVPAGELQALNTTATDPFAPRTV